MLDINCNIVQIVDKVIIKRPNCKGAAEVFYGNADDTVGSP